MISNDFRAAGTILARIQMNTRITSGFAAMAALGAPKEPLFAQNVDFPKESQ